MYFEEHGIGDPIVFIHPPAMGSITFKKQKSLSEKYKVILYDIRGNGRSEFSNEDITITLLAHDLKALVDHLNLKNVILCAYSYGGAIALEFALLYPDHVKGIILCGGFSEVSSFRLQQQFKIGIFIAQVRGIKLLAKALATSHTQEKPFQRELQNYIEMVNPRILYQMYKEGLYYNCTVRLSQIKIPLLLIYGSRDHYIHGYQTLFKNNISQTDVIYISKAKHQIPTKFYQEYNTVIDKFVQSI